MRERDFTGEKISPGISTIPKDLGGVHVQQQPWRYKPSPHTIPTQKRPKYGPLIHFEPPNSQWDIVTNYLPHHLKTLPYKFFCSEVAPLAKRTEHLDDTEVLLNQHFGKFEPCQHGKGDGALPLSKAANSEVDHFRFYPTKCDQRMIKKVHRISEWNYNYFQHQIIFAERLLCNLQWNLW